MKSKEFDQLVRQSFEHASLPYNQANWNKLSNALDEQEKKKRRFVLWPLVSVAASLVAVLGVFALMKSQGVAERQLAGGDMQKTELVAGNIAGNTHAAKQEPIVGQATSEPIKPATALNDTDTENKPENHPGTNADQATTPDLKRVASIDAIAINSNRSVELHRKEFPEVTSDIPIPNAQAAVSAPVKEQKPVRSLATITNPNNYQDEIRPVKTEKKQFISMAGGLNYGTMNGGYVMGFSAGTKLSGRFYVESDVAFVGNIASEKNKQTFTTKSSNPYARSTSISTSSITVQRFYNLYYAQVTPTLGYRVGNKISVGVGADVQRLLIGDVLVTETEDPADARELPGYDMGVVGKTEYKLSKDVRASVYYRKAMNQALSGNSKLLERDYLQVQLKFNIFNK